MLDKVSLFESLSPEDRAELELGVHIQHFQKGSILVHQGDDSNNMLYIILSGRLKVFTGNEEGKEALLTFMESGDAFGELSLFDEQPRSASVMAVEDCQVGLFPRSHLFECMRRNPNIAIELLKTVMKRMRNTTEQVSSLALLDVYGRIAKTLSTLAKTRPDGTVITGPLTHQELSSMVGASREMVTRILNDLKRGGYIATEHHCIEIKKPLPTRW
jgi:CRP/FNR family cyclic AMP-dependent transcriptional regulator